MEQVNIEGKRSGNGFVAHRDKLLKSLGVAQGERLEICDCFIGRRGFLSYLKALGGSNVVKVVPSNGSASEAQATAKYLKVIIGHNEGFIPEGAWIKDKTPYTVCQARVSPTNGVIPNLSGIELSEALQRTLPFTTKDKNAPAFSQVVHFKQVNGLLMVVVTTNTRIAEVTLDGVDGEGIADVAASDIKSLVGALRRAKRVRLSFAENGIVLDTELIRYKYPSVDINYPNWQNFIPSDLGSQAYFDSKEAIKSSQSLGAMWISQHLKPQYNTLILSIEDSRLTLTAQGNTGSQAHIPADTEGEAVIALQARYLTQALKACGGMVSLKVKDEKSPALFETDGYRLLVMPMTDIPEVAKVKEPKAEAKEQKAKGKPKEKAKTEAKEPVSVAS